MYFVTELLEWYRAVFLVLRIILFKSQIANMGEKKPKGRLHPIIVKSYKECV